MKRHITFSMVLLSSADGKAIQSAATNQKMMESRREKESNGGMRRIAQRMQILYCRNLYFCTIQNVLNLFLKAWWKVRYKWLCFVPKTNNFQANFAIVCFCKQSALCKQDRNEVPKSWLFPKIATFQVSQKPLQKLLITDKTRFSIKAKNLYFSDLPVLSEQIWSIDRQFLWQRTFRWNARLGREGHN